MSNTGKGSENQNLQNLMGNPLVLFSCNGEANRQSTQEKLIQDKKCHGHNRVYPKLKTKLTLLHLIAHSLCILA